MIEEKEAQVSYKRGSEIGKRNTKNPDIGLQHGKSSLSSVFPKISREAYYLLGGAAKSGKSSLLDDLFVYNPIRYLRPEQSLTIDYFSLELSKEFKSLRATCWHIMEKKGKSVSNLHFEATPQRFPVSEAIELADEVNEDLDLLNEHVNLYTDVRTVEGIISTLDNNIDTDKVNDPNHYHLVIIDHLARAVLTKGGTTKDAMDELSKKLVYYRNNYKITPVVVQQLKFNNSEKMHTKRKKEPTTDDFGDSRNTIQDCDLCLGLYDPLSEMMSVDNYDGYDVKRLNGGFRNLEVLVNRSGVAGVSSGMFYDGPSGYFVELPPPDHYDKLEKIYNKVETEKFRIEE